MDTFFDQQRLSLWPVTLILAADGKKASFDTFLRMVNDYLHSYRFCADRDIGPGELKHPCHAEQVLRWVEHIWTRLASAEEGERHSVRRAILQEIVGSSLIPDEQYRLVSALDYLFRFSAARNRAIRSGSGSLARIPHTENRLMQTAYQKLAGLAAADLPVWITGERGTESETLARLVHALRGLPEKAFHIWDCTESSSSTWRVLRNEWCQEDTIFVPEIHLSPRSFQKMLYRQVREELSSLPSFGIVVSSDQVEPSHIEVPGMIPELFAFLEPMRVEIPPLRNRTEDIPALTALFCESRDGTDNPLARFAPQTLKALREHHWPGNVEELEMVMAFTLRKRPSGSIRVDDLPDTIRPLTKASTGLLHALEQILEDEGFRLLRSDAGRRSLALFLTDHTEGTFGAGDVQRHLGMGRETVRRLLFSLQARGLIEGMTGSEGKRVTRYRVSFPDHF